MISPTNLLALLVHRGDVSADTARDAMKSGDPGCFLVEKGLCDQAQWEAWLRTEGGTRPVLSRYELGDQIGEGGVGRVFAAHDKTDKVGIALKILKSELATDPVQTERFIREARLLMKLSHPHLVKGLRVAKEGDAIFFAMEQLPGECLQDVLVEQERLSEEDALTVVVQVAGALSALHAEGLVHRDVKPGNILWSEERGAVLIDLGFAVQSDGGGGGGGGGGETTAGTVHYIAPEQARGDGNLDVRADIYALGATLYHLTTGSLPFEGRTSEEVLAKQVLESLSGERIRALSLSPQLHYFLEKMMAKDPDMRFQSPQQLGKEVQAFLDQVKHNRDAETRQRERPKLGDRRNRALQERRTRRRRR